MDRQRRAGGGNHRTRGSDAARFLRWTAIGTLLPGAGLVAAGRRRAGFTLLGVFAGSVVALLVAALAVPRSTLVALAVSPRWLTVIGGLLALGALGWLAVALVSHHRLDRADLRTSQRLVGAGLVAVLVPVVAAPLALASRYAFVQRDLVDTVFEESADQGVSFTRPTAATRADPWAGTDRVTVLLLGGDAGEDRIGTRTDTMIIASLDTHTGETVLFSLPRNLQNAPFPEDSPLHDAYPRGFRGPGEVGEYLLNAVYPNIPVLHPEVFEGVTNPGAEAIKLAAGATLGLDIDYYALVNLDGFQQIVDALGGIELNVRTRVPVGSIVAGSGRCTRAQEWIEPGRQTLDGYHALWFARARCGAEGVSDDYDRIERQRCVVGAVIEQADPATLLRRYQQLATVTKDIVQTDVPQELLPAFTELALQAKEASVRSVAFTPRDVDGFSPADPDFDEIRALVQQALAPAPAATVEAPTTAPDQPATDPTAGPSAEPTPDTSRGTDLDAVC